MKLTFKCSAEDKWVVAFTKSALKDLLSEELSLRVIMMCQLQAPATVATSSQATPLAIRSIYINPLYNNSTDVGSEIIYVTARFFECYCT